MADPAVGGVYDPARTYPSAGGGTSGDTLTNATLNGTTTIATGATLTAPAISGATITGTVTVGAGATLTSPTLVTPALGTPASGTLTSCTGLPISTGVAGLGTGIATALAVNTGSAGAPVLLNGALGTPTSGTLGGMVNSDFKVLAATATYDNTTTLATLTGFSWTLVAGTYVFGIELPTTMTTNGGLAVAFTYTTLVATSIRVNTYQSTAADNTTAVSGTSTTTTSATKFIDNKDAAYTVAKLSGAIVVGTGGTLAVQAAQNTGASGADASAVLIGATAYFHRVA